MTPARRCCNPFKKIGHNKYIKNLTFLSKSYDKRFSCLHGLYVCPSCKTKLYKNINSLDLKEKKGNDVEVRKKVESESEEEDEEEAEISVSSGKKEDKDFIFPRIDDQAKRIRLAASLNEAILNPKVNNLNLSNNDSKILRSICNNQGDNDLASPSDNESNKWIDELKASLSTTSSREQKIFLLTTVPSLWSIRKTATEFNVSRRMVKTARTLQNEKGYGTFPAKKKRPSYVNRRCK